MSQYIDKAILKAELERIEYETNYETFTDEVLGKRKVCKDIKDFLDSLEAKEEVLDENDKSKLMQKCVKTAYKRGYDMGVLQTTNKMNSNTKEVDLENSMVCKVDWYDGFFLDYTQEQQDKLLEKIGANAGDKIRVILIKE